ncbi:hypothetical protein DICVIV_00235 [Dictyocaulus viviparus]|uniref:Uncharacterized protein n=1 Tax=Dictyocaulus viviparus TaxID=29172 RepID=A0A0D8YBA9_DICVI|nr:hypothetical protein DICVIV_00235 [Dictyocaulus viviparus]
MGDVEALEVLSSVVDNETSEVRFKMVGSEAAEVPHRKFQSSNMEATLRRTPAMGLKAEARKISYIRNKRLQHHPSLVSCRSINVYRRALLNRIHQNALKSKKRNNSNSVKQWTEGVINRISFNRLFKNHPS